MLAPFLMVKNKHLLLLGNR